MGIPWGIASMLPKYYLPYLMPMLNLKTRRITELESPTSFVICYPEVLLVVAKIVMVFVQYLLNIYEAFSTTL